MRQEQRAPVAPFERYYNKEYSEERAWNKNRGGYTRHNVLPISRSETEKIGVTWDENTSQVATRYYRDAEEQRDIFWGANSIFYEQFKRLDCSSIIEIACGHGRHVDYYLQLAEKITLVDINKSNIDFCKSRYPSENKIEYIVNSGSDFPGVASDSQTAVFSYDAMVHFELLDVLGYLKEANRVLKLGGRLLLHHSNIDFYPELSCLQKPLWRNFMSADIFVYLATRSGFKVLSQHVISFGRGKNFYPNTDCLSLCEKIWTI